MASGPAAIEVDQATSSLARVMERRTNCRCLASQEEYGFPRTPEDERDRSSKLDEPIRRSPYRGDRRETTLLSEPPAAPDAAAGVQGTDNLEIATKPSFAYAAAGRAGDGFIP